MTFPEVKRGSPSRPVEIGEHYIDAEKQRVTPIEYNDVHYVVNENLWEQEDDNNVWQVTLQLSPDFSSDVSREDIHGWLRRKQEIVEVMGALDYTVYKYDDRTSFWQKVAESTNDNRQN